MLVHRANLLPLVHRHFPGYKSAHQTVWMAGKAPSERVTIKWGPVSWPSFAALRGSVGSFISRRAVFDAAAPMKPWLAVFPLPK